ncbi:hypothetical protein [Sphingopyxis panaciterrae]
MRALLPIVVAALFAAPAAHAESPAGRAKRNYEMLMRGQKQVGDLSPAERAEVARLDQLLRMQPRDTRPAAERCRDEEIKRAGGSPSELELRIIGLKCSQR